MKYQPSPDAVAIEMTDELKAKLAKVSKAFIAMCRVEGLSPIESYVALNFVTGALEDMLGGKLHGAIIVDNDDVNQS